MDYDAKTDTFVGSDKTISAAEMIAREVAERHKRPSGGELRNPFLRTGPAPSEAIPQPASVLRRLDDADRRDNALDQAIGEVFRRINDIDENLANIRNAVGLDPWRAL